MLRNLRYYYAYLVSDYGLIFPGSNTQMLHSEIMLCSHYDWNNINIIRSSFVLSSNDQIERKNWQTPKMFIYDLLNTNQSKHLWHHHRHTLDQEPAITTQGRAAGREDDILDHTWHRQGPVSWVRKIDYHILTVDTYRYTTDQRFTAFHEPASSDWTLEIQFSMPEDEGWYECQVNSEPKISKLVKLILVAANVRILGQPKLYVKKGSTINLVCEISNATQPPVYVFWYHNEKVINYDNPRDIISVKTEKSITTTSSLNIASATKEDSGMYSCAPSYADPAIIKVSVINGNL
ncbi:Roundabout 2 [Nymphon striatum]|nr:Roundabout 2 [Nymphon striatum]